tara:strand:- start:4056 stop:5810 length:1755 start_codon:yes stop_codon:yes gene_type:complete
MAIPEYQRTILRQVQQADTASAQVWETLANTLDNFGRQAGALSRNMMANEKAQAAAEKQANDLATKTYLDGKETEIIKAAHQASINNSDDYEGYLNEFNSQAKVFLEAEGLNSLSGARPLLETMINKKRQQYGEKPYEATQIRIQTEGIEAAEENIQADLDDYLSQSKDYIERFQNLIDNKELEVSEDFKKMQEGTFSQLGKLFQKLDDLEQLNGQDPEKVAIFQKEIIDRYVSGVLQSQLTLDTNEGHGWESLVEFYEDPNKFLRKRGYLSALIPKDIKIDEIMASEIYQKGNQYLSDYHTALKRKTDKEQKAIDEEQLDNFNMLMAGLEEGFVATNGQLFEMKQNNIINSSQYYAAVQAIQGDEFFREDKETLYDLDTLMVDPKATTEEKNDAIIEAYTNFSGALISRESFRDYQKQIIDSSKVTADPYYSIGRNDIAKAFGFQDAWAFDTASGDEVEKVRFAQRELFDRVLAGESARDVTEEIIQKYRNTYQPSGDIQQLNYGEFGVESYDEARVLPDGFNTFFVGTPDKPMRVETMKKIGKLLREQVLSKWEADDLAQQFKDYMEGKEANADEANQDLIY